MTGIFFGGGDQSRLVKLMTTTTLDGIRVDTPLLEEIRHLHQNGKMIAGTSAGCVALTWLTSILTK